VAPRISLLGGFGLSDGRVDVALALAVAGCGSDDGRGDDPAAEVDTSALSGTIEVWGMGAEGEAAGGR
jgi:hypothetical protein